MYLSDPEQNPNQVGIFRGCCDLKRMSFIHSQNSLLNLDFGSLVGWMVFERERKGKMHLRYPLFLLHCLSGLAISYRARFCSLGEATSVILEGKGRSTFILVG